MKAISHHRLALLWLVPALALLASGGSDEQVEGERQANDVQESREEPAVQIQYLEIVTPDVDATCKSLEGLHGVTFGEPVAALGNARTAPLAGGGRIGVRAPMRDTEEPVVRPYVLVDDVEKAAEAAAAAGGEVALPPTELAGEGRISIYLQGGIQHGLWQL